MPANFVVREPLEVERWPVLGLGKHLRNEFVHRAEVLVSVPHFLVKLVVCFRVVLQHLEVVGSLNLAEELARPNVIDDLVSSTLLDKRWLVVEVGKGGDVAHVLLHALCDAS